MKRRILWIEDSAFDENRSLATPVYLAGNFDLQVALNATDGARLLQNMNYDAIVVDIRILPGSGPEWIAAYIDSGERKEAARLGLKLLNDFLGEAPEAWRKKIGVLTVETRDELRQDLERLGVLVYRKKEGLANKAILLEVIQEIIKLNTEVSA